MAVMTVSRTTIGQKVLMAVTGLIWIGFLVLHMYGNTKAFSGQQTFNDYAHHLRTFGEPVLGYLQFLTAFRIITVVALVTHMYLAYALTRRAMASRGQRYAVKKSVQADYASLTMRWGGVAIALFILYHLAQFTWGVEAVLPGFDRENAYGNMVAGFQNPLNVIFYMVALFALGMHLYHGFWSMFQTLGLNNRSLTRPLHFTSIALAILVAGGFALVPLSVAFGLIA
jgi:succinate dehydrogenase / fumarate reductase cytochrome b subunit